MPINIKKILFLFILSVVILNVNAQINKKYIYYLDEKLNSTDPNNAVIFGEGFYKDGRFELKCYDRYVTKLFVTFHSIDSSLAELEGLYTIFHLNGEIEEEGNYHESEKTGIWQKWDSTGKKTDSTIFKEGYPIWSESYHYEEDGKLSRLYIKDSLKNTFQAKFFDSSSNLEGEVFFNGNRGERKTYLSNGISRDSLFSREEIESQYPGGPKAFSNYLRRSLNAGILLENKTPLNFYTVIIKFTVDKDGKIIDIISENKQGYGLDEHAIDVIRKSGDWIPGSQFGIKIKSIKRQPISFFKSEEERI